MTNARRAAMFVVHANVKDAFFDRAKVLQMVHAQNRRRLGRAGAYVRQRARTDILRRGPKSRNGNRKTSTPGRPPYVHSRDSFATLRNILFYVSGDWESVIIGPRAVKSLKLKRATYQYVPGLLEFGGTSELSQVYFRREDEWVSMTEKATNWFEKRGLPTRNVKGTYRPRPFMGPALDKEVKAGTIGGLWMSRG
jgi:hypothetical protein